jgi:hypothetical protein
VQSAARTRHRFAEDPPCSRSRGLSAQAPPKISPGATGSDAQPVASGKIKQDIERKGPDSSYYYAHDRKTDYTVPTVPKKINADGSMSAWDGK